MSKLEKINICIDGFFNSHIHLGGSLFEDISSENIDLSDFIAFSDFWNEKLKLLKLDKIAWDTAAEYSARLAKFYGTNSVCTMLGDEILNSCGLCNSLIGYPVMNSKKLSKYLNNLEASYKAFRENILAQNMRPGIFLHSLYANDAETLEVVSRLLKRYPEDFLQIHIAEDTATNLRVFQKYGMSEVDVLKKYNLLTKNTMLVHCCQLTDEELELISSYGVTVVICPESNLRVGQMPLNPARLINKNINWLIASDGLGTGGTLNLRKQAKTLKALYPNIDYVDLLKAISTRPDDLQQNKMNIKSDKKTSSNQIAMQLIENCDIDVFNQSSEDLKLLELVKQKLKKYKPTKIDFESWKKGENYD